MHDYFPVEGYKPQPIVYDQERGGDHYPLMTVNPYPPGGTPARDLVVSAPAAPPVRFVKRGSYMVCETCNLTSMYCRGHAAPAQGASDGAESSLEQRVRECKGR